MRAVNAMASVGRLQAWPGALPVALPVVVPDQVFMPSLMQVFMFSAVTWNRHHIHYSREAAQREGHQDVVVQRALLGNYFAQHLQRWMGPQGQIQALQWRVRRSAYPGQALRCRGFITQVTALDEPAALGPAADHHHGLLDAARTAWRLRYEGTLCNEQGQDVAQAQAWLSTPELG